MATLQAREMWAMARSKRCSAAILFVDICGAFDAVVRSVLMGKPPGEDLEDLEVAAILKTLGFAPSELREVIALIPQVSYMQACGMSATVAHSVREAHESSWFVVQGSSQVTLTRVGSKPGDPLGDLVFNWMMLKVRSAIDADLARQDLVERMPTLPDALADVLGHV